MILKLSMDLPEDQNYMRLTRLLGRTLLEHLQVDEKDLVDLELMLGELCSNVIRHAHTCDGRFLVTLEYYADRVVVTVEDQGPGFSFKAVPEVGSLRPDNQAGGERIGGFGLQLIETLADHLEFHRTDPHGTTGRAEKRLHYRNAAAAEQAVQMDGTAGHPSAVINAQGAPPESGNPHP